MNGVYNNNGGVFEIADDVSLDLSGIDFCGFFSGGSGGVILNYGILSVDSCAFEDNASVGSGGGCIYSESDAYPEIGLTCNNVSFDGSIAENGGAVLVAEGTALFTECTFGVSTRNYCNVSGGALLTAYGTEVDIEDCEFANNFSTGEGGALWAGDLVNILDSYFHDNEASNEGGAIYVYLSGNVYADSVTITQNECDPLQHGGGVRKLGSFTATNSTITGNIPDNVY